MRNGLHATAARDIEDYVDFFDWAFGRTTIEPPRTLLYDYTFEKWLRQSGEEIDPLAHPEAGLQDLFVDASRATVRSAADWWKKKKKDILERVRWGLGEKPAGATNPGPREFKQQLNDDYLHRGDLMGIAPTGCEVRLAAIEIFRVAKGKIAEQWVLVDNLGMLQQPGVFPPAAQA